MGMSSWPGRQLYDGTDVFNHSWASFVLSRGMLLGSSELQDNVYSTIFVIAFVSECPISCEMQHVCAFQAQQSSIECFFSVPSAYPSSCRFKSAHRPALANFSTLIGKACSKIYPSWPLAESAAGLTFLPLHPSDLPSWLRFQGMMAPSRCRTGAELLTDAGWIDVFPNPDWWSATSPLPRVKTCPYLASRSRRAHKLLWKCLGGGIEAPSAKISFDRKSEYLEKTRQWKYIVPRLGQLRIEASKSIHIICSPCSKLSFPFQPCLQS